MVKGLLFFFKKKRIISFVFPGGMLTSTRRFDVTSGKFQKQTCMGLCFVISFIPLKKGKKVPIMTCIVCLKVISLMYYIVLPFFLLTKCKGKKNNPTRIFLSSLVFGFMSVLCCTVRSSSFTVFSVSKPNQNNVSLVLLLL